MQPSVRMVRRLFLYICLRSALTVYTITLKMPYYGRPYTKVRACPRCGMELDILFLFCPYCGHEIRNEACFTPLAMRAFSRPGEGLQDFLRDRFEDLDERLSKIEHDIDVLVR